MSTNNECYDSILRAYRDARDEVLAHIMNGGGVIEIEIRNRRVRNSDPFELLDTLEKQIDKYEDKCSEAQAKGKSTVNRVYFKRS